MFENFPFFLLSPIVFITIMSFMFCVIAVIGSWEKRLVWNYQPISRTDDEAECGVARCTFVDNRGRELEDVGFMYVGTTRDAKGDKYKVIYEFWLSPDRQILAMVGGGTIIGLVCEAVCLFSRLEDGRCLQTISHQNVSEFDPTGITEEALVATKDLRQLLRRHRNRLAKATVAVLEYSKDPLKDHLEYRFRRFNSLVQMGRAKFLDEAETQWKYTVWGAIAFSFTGLTRGLRRSFWPDKA